MNTITVIKTLYDECLKNNPEYEYKAEVEQVIREIVTIRDIKLFVYSCFGIPEEIADRSNRFGELVQARQIAMSLCHKYGDWSSGAIGYEIGGKDHATVLHAIKTVQNHIETEKDYRRMYEKIEGQLIETFKLCIPE